MSVDILIVVFFLVTRVCDDRRLGGTYRFHSIPEDVELSLWFMKIFIPNSRLY